LLFVVTFSHVAMKEGNVIFVMIASVFIYLDPYNTA
jgi:hypothetical protein